MDKILEKINSAGLKFLGTQSLLETYKTVIKEAVKLLSAQYGALYIRENDSFIKSASYPSREKIIHPRKKGYNYQAFIDNKILVVKRSDIKNISFLSAKEKYRCSIYLPISDHEHTIGTINLLYKKEKSLSQKEYGMLKIFGSYASLAIKKAKLLEDQKEALLIRDQFITLISHELRTPLTSINGYIQLLNSKAFGENCPEGKWVKELLKESGRLTAMILDMMEINSMRAGKYQFNLRENRLVEVINKSISSFKSHYPERDISFKNESMSGNGLVVCDFEKLTGVFFHLLENAAKFSPENSKIKMLLKRENSHFVIRIRDQGNGVSKENIPRITNGFYKIGEKQNDGIGVGLLKNKFIVTNHGGSLKIFSTKNLGTTVEVKLPLLN